MNTKRVLKFAGILLSFTLLFVLFSSFGLAAANFAVNITQVITSPTTVSQGQTGIVVDVKIANTLAENANITNVTLFFFNNTINNSALIQGNATLNYTISLQNATPLLINGSGNGSNTTYVRFLVNVSNLALNQSININASVSATNSTIGNSGANTTDVTFAFGDSWTVQTPANINITNISASPFILSATNTLTLSVALANLGEATADVTAGSNVTNSTVLGFLANLTSTAVQNLSVLRSDSVTTIAGGSTGTLTFTIARGQSNYEGNVTVNATVQFNDTNTGNRAPNSANRSSRDSAFQTDYTTNFASGGVIPTRSGNTVTISFTTSETATCTYSATGITGATFSTTGGTTQQTSFTAPNGVIRFLITCTDSAGNVGSFYTDWIDVGSVGITGGGGGSGGGSSATAPSLSAGQETSVSLTDSGNTGVTEILITSNTALKNVGIVINKLLLTPSSPAISQEQGEVYKYFMVNKVNLQDSQIEQAKVHFQVEKAWLTGKGISSNTVSLRRLQSDGWKELSTHQIGETETHIQFEAVTPGFSTFAITAGYKELPTPSMPPPQPAQSTSPVVKSTPPQSKSAPVTSSAPNPAPEATPSVPSSTPEAQPTPVEAAQNTNPLIYLGILIVVIVILYYAYSAATKRKSF